MERACYPPPVAVVGLAERFYEVDEDVGGVQVCVELKTESQDCVISFPFNITLQTSDLTGTYNTRCMA